MTRCRKNRIGTSKTPDITRIVPTASEKKQKIFCSDAQMTNKKGQKNKRIELGESIGKK